jgi:integrase
MDFKSWATPRKAPRQSVSIYVFKHGSALGWAKAQPLCTRLVPEGIMLFDLNEKWIRALEPKTLLKRRQERVIVWDESQKGLGLVVFRSGNLSWVLRYSVNGKPGKTTLGQWPDLTYEMAKKKAQRLRGQIADGIDPARGKADGVDIEDLFDRMRKDYYPGLAVSTVKSYETLIDLYIVPKLGKIPVDGLALQDVAKLHHSMRHIERSANQALAVLARALHMAETWGLRPPNSNPCPAIQRFTENKRERYLTKDEMALLGDRLRALEPSWNPYTVAALRFAMLTGMRRGEVGGLKWASVKGDRLILKEHKTAKKAGARTVNLAPPAVLILKGLDKMLGCPYVFAGEKGGTCLASLRKLWDLVREGTSFKDVRIHDLRHTFASIGLMEGLTLEQIGGLLGHKAAATTKRYAHLMQDAAIVAASKTGAAVAARLNSGA